MDNVSFPSRLFIIYDLTTKKTGVSPVRNIEHTYTHATNFCTSYLSTGEPYKTTYRKNGLRFLLSSIYPIIHLSVLTH